MAPLCRKPFQKERLGYARPVFLSRRERFLSNVPDGSVVLLLGNSTVTRSNDTDYPFRQDSDFWYLTGFGHPNAVAILQPDRNPRFTLFVEPRDRTAETWTGYRPGVEGAKIDYGADEALPRQELHERLPELLGPAERIYHVLGRNSEIDALITGTLDEMRQRSRTGKNPASELIDPRTLLHEMRLYKSHEELEIMRRAADITREAHLEAACLAQAGHIEYELEAALGFVFRRRGAVGPAYTSIVGSGANATVLHYISNNAELRPNELVLVDAGCELEGYASDVTRTYPVGGRYEGTCKDVYEVVLASQEAAIACARPGVTLQHVHDCAVHSLVEGMVAIGLLRGDIDDLIAQDAFRRYYMHNTSHWLGLDVHDAGAYTINGEPRPLATGMVFTVEPGIYVPLDDKKCDRQFRGVGVRIEDDVVVTADGVENLTAAIPKRPEDVEAWIQEASST